MAVVSEAGALAATMEGLEVIAAAMVDFVARLKVSAEGPSDAWADIRPRGAALLVGEHGWATMRPLTPVSQMGAGTVLDAELASEPVMPHLPVTRRL